MSKNIPPPENPQRRKFMRTAAAAAGGVALSSCQVGGGRPALAADAAPQPMTNQPLPNPEDTGIDHVVVLMMENRSFDHFLGWVPGADGKQAGLSYRDANGNLRSTFDLGARGDFQGCGLGDPNHGYNGGRVHYNDGQMDGWLLTGPTADNPDVDDFPLGHPILPSTVGYDRVHVCVPESNLETLEFSDFWVERRGPLALG